MILYSFFVDNRAPDAKKCGQVSIHAFSEKESVFFVVNKKEAKKL
jgi:hypothetical protein